MMPSPPPPPPPSSSVRGSVQRRSPTSAVEGSSGTVTSRNSSSAKSPAARRQVNLSTIEKSVTHLLVATKQLLETLTAWSRGNATESQVSDVYVRLGSEFNIACRAFTAIGVETSDLGNVPDALRTILENTLSQEASPASLDVYLPRIREIIINLLQGLKKKQSKIRQRQARENGESTRSSGGQPDPPPRIRSNESLEEQNAPPRSSSLPGSNVNRGTSSASPYPSNPRPSASSRATQSMLSNPSYQVPNSPPTQMPEVTSFHSAIPSQYFTPPPPPPEPKEDPLLALQRESALERRASRRYSAYQIAKLTGASPGGVPMLPTHQSPTPRHRESHDTLDAVRVRQPGRNRQTRNDLSPMRTNRISEERDNEPGIMSPESALPKVLDDSLPPPLPAKDTDVKAPPTLRVDTTFSSPPPTNNEQLAEYQRPSGEETKSKASAPQDGADNQRPGTAASQASQSKEITIFLQIGRSIKKTVLPDGVDDISLTSIRLLFISKFNYSPPAGEDFPEIYLQDPTSGVRYELEDLQDIKDRSVLCLNTEVLDEVKRHIDDGLGNLQKLVEGVKGLVDVQVVTLQRVAERQEEAAKKIAELSVAPTAPPTPPAVTATFPEVALKTTPAVDNNSQIAEIRDLRKDLAVLRQIYSSFVSDVNNSMSTIKAKASAVRATTENTKAMAIFNAVPSSGRLYVEEGKKTLGTDADTLVNRVDDLQDTVEELRKDVLLRGVRPLNRQLETVSKEIQQAKIELKKMSDYIKREKPKWKKVWEKELEVVCEDQQFFNMQEELITDLYDDLEKASQTFTLVEQCTEQQLKTKGQGLRVASKGFNTMDDPIDVGAAKDNVLNEVRALRPNHENRLEAIERAERLRQKELEGRVPEFQKELGKFVGENKLRKAGGVEEAERLRKARDEQLLKETWAATKNEKNAEGEVATTAPAVAVEGKAPETKADVTSVNGANEEAPPSAAAEST